RSDSDLTYKRKESRQLRIKAISMQTGTSKKTEVEFGDDQDGAITLHGPLNLTKAQLKDWAEDYYNGHVYDGYEGHISGWWQPKVKPGDQVQIKDPNYADGHRDGKYYVSSVDLTADSTNGIKRYCELAV